MNLRETGCKRDWGYDPAAVFINTVKNFQVP
jgi:hypothetical protein